MVHNVHRNHKAYGGGGGYIIYLSLHCHHQNDFYIQMGSDESHFNVLVGSDGQSHKTAVSTNHNLFEEKGESKQYRNNVLLLISLTPYLYRPNWLTRKRWAGSVNIYLNWIDAMSLTGVYLTISDIFVCLVSHINVW